MFVVEVIPLDTGASVDHLSYFSGTAYEKGAIVAVPVRARTVDAIVISSTPVSALKTALRAATFTLRKLPSGIERGHVSDSFLALVEHIAETRALSWGDVLSALIPKKRSWVRRNDATVADQGVRGAAPTHAPSFTEVIAAPRDERYSEYKRVIRETFAAHGSVLFVTPTLHDQEYAYRELSHGIENHTIILSGDMKAAALKKADRMLGSEHPLLIIASPAYAHVERADIRTVILENARSRAFRGIARPYLDHRRAIMEHARIRGARTVLGDLVLPSEDIHQLRERVYEYVAHGDFPKRLDLPGTLTIVHQKKDHDGTIPFMLFSEELIAALRTTQKKKDQMFLLSARRGLAPLVACADCGHIFRDPESGAPLSLHGVTDAYGRRMLVSSISGYRMPMPDTCPSCNSWRLRERGIGIEKIESELKKEFPDLPLFVLDHTSAKSHTHAERIAREFHDTPGSALLGTSLAIPYLEKPVARTGVVSMDALLSLPSWRQQEEAFATLLALREKTNGAILAQTRHRPDDRILALASRAELATFYDEELATRRSFAYPPYAVFILLSYQGAKEAVKTTEALLTEKFSQYGISFYGLPPTDTSKVLRRGLMRFPRESWPEKNVIEALRSLPPAIKIEFDPDRIV